MTLTKQNSVGSPRSLSETTSAHQLWQRLTLPSAAVIGIEQRRRAQFLAASLLFLVPVAFVGILLTSVFDGDGLPNSVTGWVFFGINIAVVLALILIYFISRTRYHIIGSSAVVIILALGALGLSAYSPRNSLTVMPFLSLVILVTSLLFSYQTTLGVTIGINVAGIVTLILTEGRLLEAEQDIIVFNLIMGVLIVAAALIRTRHIEMIEQQSVELDIARATLEQRVADRTRQLSERNAELKRLTYILSHDLRNHLVNFSGFTEEVTSSIEQIHNNINPLLKQLSPDQQQLMKDTLKEDIPDFMSIIDMSVGQMKHMVDAMLEMAIMDNTSLQPKSLEMKPIVDEVLTSLSTQIKQYNATVEVSQLPNIVADQLAIERILSNLIHNAVIYADPNRKSKIAITGETLDNETWFHVEDNGIGISADDTQKIFDIFQRAGNHTLSGDGMGLSFARSLVQRHGGEVKCESRVGVGSTFSFSIRHHLDVNNDLGSN